MRRSDESLVLSEALINETDKDVFRSRFDALIDLYMASDEIVPARELCEQALRRAGELGFSGQEQIGYQARLLQCAMTTGASPQVWALVEDMISRVGGGSAASGECLRALIAASFLAVQNAHLENARRYLEVAGRLAVAVSDLNLTASFKQVQGCYYGKERCFDEAREAHQTALGLSRLLGNDQAALTARMNIAHLEFDARHFRAAADRFAPCLDTLRESNQRRRLALVLTNIGICHLLLGEWRQARAELEEAEQTTRELGLRTQHTRALLALAALDTRQRRFDAARRKLAAALDLARECGLRREEAIALEFRAVLEQERGRYEQALEYATQALEKGRQIAPNSDCVSEALRHRAAALNALGRPAEALAVARQCVRLSEENLDRLEEAAATRVIAVALSSLGRPSDAEHHFRRALDQLRKIGDPYEVARTLHAFARHVLASASGPIAVGRAVEYLREARELYGRLAIDHWTGMLSDEISEIVSRETAREPAEPGEHRPDSPPPSSAVHDGAVVPEAPASPRARARRRPAPDHHPLAPDLITRSPAMHALLDRLEQVAPSRLPILIFGERGTGKELVARAIHAASGRPADRLVAVNCAAIPRELQDSELFGHVRGAFTGAVVEKAGLFEDAGGGTIFLDEVGDLGAEVQSRLLRVLETGELRRVGETRCRTVDARIVAATNRDLRRLVAEGRFRADLYDRMNGLEVELPPLRARQEDIELLVRHFLRVFGREYAKEVTISGELLQILRGYAWPGNVRELKQEVHRLVLLTSSQREAQPGDSQVVERARAAAAAGGTRARGGSAAGGDDGRGSDGRGGAGHPPALGLLHALGETERRMIVGALQKAKGNKAQAARYLDMSRTTLLGKMRRLGIES